MRHLSLVLALFCLMMLFITDSPVVLGICLLGTGLFGFLAVLGYAQARIESTSQPHFNIMSPQELAQMRQKAIQNRVNNNRAAAAGSAGGAAYTSHSSDHDDRRSGSDGDDSSDGGGDGGGGDGGGSD